MVNTRTVEPVGQRVIIDAPDDDGISGWRYGTIVGHMVLPPTTSTGEATLTYAVRLDRGFYSEDKHTHVTVLVVAADSPELRIGEE